MATATEDMVREALRDNVIDPEIGINVVDLGLVYGIDVSGEGEVEITMTLTTPMCPLGPYIDSEVRNGFNGITVKYKIDADAKQEDIEALVAQSQKRSAVYDIVTNPTNVKVVVN